MSLHQQLRVHRDLRKKEMNLNRYHGETTHFPRQVSHLVAHLYETMNLIVKNDVPCAW